MNKIEKLPKAVFNNGEEYNLNVWVTAFGELCIGYRAALNHQDHLFSVCIEPDNDIRHIKDTIGYFNEYIGNMKTFDDDCDEIMSFLEEKYRKIEEKYGKF